MGPLVPRDSWTLQPAVSCSSVFYPFSVTEQTLPLVNRREVDNNQLQHLPTNNIQATNYHDATQQPRTSRTYSTLMEASQLSFAHRCLLSSCSQTNSCFSCSPPPSLGLLSRSQSQVFALKLLSNQLLLLLFSSTIPGPSLMLSITGICSQVALKPTPASPVLLHHPWAFYHALNHRCLLSSCSQTNSCFSCSPPPSLGLLSRSQSQVFALKLLSNQLLLLLFSSTIPGPSLTLSITGKVTLMEAQVSLLPSEETFDVDPSPSVHVPLSAGNRPPRL